MTVHNISHLGVTLVLRTTYDSTEIESSFSSNVRSSNGTFLTVNILAMVANLDETGKLM
jgi:hypothetical protein